MSEIINPSLKTAVKGTIVVFLGMVLSMLLWFATKLLIIRNTTKEELGIYSLVVAIVGMCSLVATLGLQEGIARYVSLYLGEGKKESAEAASRTSVSLGIISSTGVFILIYFFSGFISQHLFYKPELEYPLKIMSFFIPFSAMTAVRSGILRGFNMMQAKVYADTGQPLFFLVILAAVFILHLPFPGVIWAYVVSMTLVFVFMSLYCFKKTGLNPFSMRGGGMSKELLRFSLPLLTVSLLGIALNLSDTLMLGRYATAEDVGVYNVSMSLARLLVFPFSALGFVFMPLAGAMYSKGQLLELKRTYQILTKWIFSATLPLFVILFIFSEMTLVFLFGKNFVDSSMPLRILAVGFLFQTFLGASDILLLVMGMSRLLMQLSFFGVIFNIALTYILVKLLGYGVIGASIALVVSDSIIYSVIVMFLYRKFKIHPFTPEHIKPVIGTAVIGLIIYVIAKNLPLYLWMMPLYLILFIIGYLILLLITRSLGREDIALFESIAEKTGLEMRLLKKIMYKFAAD